MTDLDFRTKPSLEDLTHFGVKGMKWGVRKREANSAQIVAARRRLKADSKSYATRAKKLDTAKGADKAKLEASLRKQHQAYLKDPDRVIAARMTRGEKATSALFGLGSVSGLVVTAGTIGGSAITSRVIAAKQAGGAYNRVPSGRVRKHIGGHTGARTAVMLGATLGPGIVRYAGGTATSAIATKAATNRAAATAARRAPKAIGSTAAKLKYAKRGLGGVHKITTMR